MIKPASCLVLLAAAASTATADQPPSTTYTYDARGRLETVSAEAGTTRYRYFDDGLIADVLHPDGKRDSYSHETLIAGQRLARTLAATEAAQSSSGPEASHNRFGFTSHLFDFETGLYYANARYYDPQIGRFVSQDSFLGRPDDAPSLHRYAYGRANPTRFVDPSGHDAFQLDMQMSGLLDARRQKEVDRAERRAIGSLLGTAEFVAHSAIGLVKAAGTLVMGAGGRSSSIESGKRSLDDTQAFFKDAGGNLAVGTNQALDRAHQDIQSGNDLGAGRGLTRDVVAPLGTAVLTAGEGLLAGGRAVAAAIPKRGPPVLQAPKTIPIADALPSGAAFTVTEDGAQFLTPSRAVQRPSPQVEKLAGSKLEHMNASIAEVHGYGDAVAQGHLPIRGPVKTTAPGADYVTFDPVRQEVVLWDSKYRGPMGGSVPKTLAPEKVKRWTPEARKAIELLPDSPVKGDILRALDAGQVRGEIFKWPK